MAAAAYRPRVLMVLVLVLVLVQVQPHLSLARLIGSLRRQGWVKGRRMQGCAERS